MSLVNAPIHDLLIRIKNAYMAKRTQVTGVPHSKFKEQVLQLLQQYRFIRGFEKQTIDNKQFFSIDLYVTGNMNEDVPVVKLYSKPSRRWYIGWKEIKPVAAGRGIGILSTNKGLMAAHEARQKKL